MLAAIEPVERVCAILRRTFIPKKVFWVLVFFVSFFNLISFAEPLNLEDFNTIKAEFRSIPYGAWVEGSVGYGGIQPDYLIDTESKELKRVFRYADKVRHQTSDVWEKIDLISWYTRRYVFPQGDYDSSDYLNLLKRYREKNEPVPLSEYIKCRSGVCREYSMLNHLLLERAGVKNFHAYAQIHRASQFYQFDIHEDHGFNVVRVKNEDWVIDPYYWGFHGFKLEDLFRPQGITADVETAPVARPAPGFRSITKIHEFPRMWVRKESCAQILNRL